MKSIKEIIQRIFYNKYFNKYVDMSKLNAAQILIIKNFKENSSNDITLDKFWFCIYYIYVENPSAVCVLLSDFNTQRNTEINFEKFVKLAKKALTHKNKGICTHCQIQQLLVKQRSTL